jgi:hypothetical protein
MATAAKPVIQEDERTKIGGAPEVRGDRGAEQDSGRDGSGLESDADFEKYLQDEFDQSALPTAPLIPGFHVCWLTTASSYDSIQKRQRLGYVLVRQSELPGFDASNGQSLTGYDGLITCNEMVLGKIADSRYQAIMKFFHHTKPMQEEEGVVGKFNQQGERLTDADDGAAAMEREIAALKNKVPHFS